MPTKNTNLTAARRAKNDEFYTQLADIENELIHYKSHFKNQIVYCNCDNPKYSNFIKYFRANFVELKLKDLLFSWYKSDHILGDSGDFRSPESIKLLKQSDIVVTNPPFSLFREYVAQLINYKKKFLIIGNAGAVSYKEIFPLIRDNKIWWGYSKRGMLFRIPNDSGAHSKIINGEKYSSVNAVWYTNLIHARRDKDFHPQKKYCESPDKYPKYDNHAAINIDKTNDIPQDYPGVMGVPITFLDKYNSTQFELVGELGDGKIAGKNKYARLLIRNRHPVKCNK